jgi:Spy/CpxP family protein refolding chaperone
MTRNPYVTIVLLATLATACSRPASTTDATNVQPGAAGAMSQGGAARTHRFAKILETLNLSDAQKDKIRAIMADARAKSKDADPETRKANFKAAFAQIDTILSPDQRTQLHAKLQSMRRNQETPAGSTQ